MSMLSARQSSSGQQLTEEEESCHIASSHFKDCFHFGKDVTLLVPVDTGYLVCAVTHSRRRPGHNTEGQFGLLGGQGHNFHSSI